MSTRGARWILWLGLVLLLPLPIIFLGPGGVPVGRIAMLGTISLAVVVLENTRGAPGFIAAIFLAQSVIYAGLLWLAAGWSTRLLRRLSSRALAGVVGGLIVLGILVSSAFEIYRTPYSARAARVGLLHLYE